MSTPSMTSRERVLAAIRRQPVDYVPCSTWFNPLTPPQRIGYTWQFPWRRPEEELPYTVEQLGLDQVVWLGIEDCPDPEVSCRAWREGAVLHQTWRTPSGELHAAVTADERWPFGEEIPLFHDFIGHYVEPWLKTERDVACLRHLIRPPHTREQLDRARENFQARRVEADRYRLAVGAYLGMGLTGAMQLASATEVCLMAAERPELLEAYLELEHRRNLRAMELAIEWGADIVQRNGFYESADFYSPALLERLLGPRLRAEAALVHQAGLPFAYTLHTGVMPMLDYLDGLGLDCLFGLDIVFQGVDLDRIRDRLGARMCFWTGPSSTYHIFPGPEEAVRAAVRRVFATFGRRGLILAAAVSSHSIMPWAHTLAMIDEWKRLRNP